MAYVTSPGYGEGAGWRERVGLWRGGPTAVITTLGVLRFDPDTREMNLASIHPGAPLSRSSRLCWMSASTRMEDFMPWVH